MKIGIDISQIIYEGTGVAEYVQKLVENVLRSDSKNEYILFFSHHSASIDRYESRFTEHARARFHVKKFPFPPQLLEFVWNDLHILPIEWLIGDVDVFYTSDWTEPPAWNAKKVTTIHDLSVLKVPETFDRHISAVHKRKLRWVAEESALILCDSEATKKDAQELLGIEEGRLRVVYPGIGYSSL